MDNKKDNIKERGEGTNDELWPQQEESEESLLDNESKKSQISDGKPLPEETANSKDEKQGIESEESADDTEEEEEEEEDSSDGADDRDAQIIEEQPKEYQNDYGKIMWAKQGKFIWWPVYIYNPLDTSGDIRELAMKTIGKKHLVWFFGTKNFATIPLSKLHDWKEYYEEHHTGKGNSKRFKKDFEHALIEAAEEYEKPEEERLEQQHKSTSPRAQGKKSLKKGKKPKTTKQKSLKPKRLKQSEKPSKKKKKAKKPKKLPTPEPSSEELESESDVLSDEFSEHGKAESSESSEEEFKYKANKGKKRPRATKELEHEEQEQESKPVSKKPPKKRGKKKQENLEADGVKKRRAMKRLEGFVAELPPPSYVQLEREGKKTSRKPLKKRVGQIKGSQQDEDNKPIDYTPGIFRKHAAEKVQGFISQLPPQDIKLEREKPHVPKMKKKEAKIQARNKEKIKEEPSKEHSGKPRPSKTKEEPSKDDSGKPRPSKIKEEPSKEDSGKPRPSKVKEAKKARKRKLENEEKARQSTPAKKSRENESPLARMIRMRKAIEEYCKKDTLDVRRATKGLVKLGQVPELYTAEMLSNTGIASLISNLRKHENPEISQTAKKLRKYMKAKLKGGVSNDSKKLENPKEEPKQFKEADRAVEVIPKVAYENVTETTRKDQLQAFSIADSVSRGHYSTPTKKEQNGADSSSRSPKVQNEQMEEKLEGARAKALILLNEVIAQSKNERYSELCKKIELEAFKLDQKSTGPSYKRHIRNAAFSLEGAKGQQLCQKLLVGSLSIADFLKLSPEEINVMA